LYVVYYPGNVVTKERLKKILFRATNFLLTLPFFLVTLIKKNLQSAAIVIIIVVVIVVWKRTAGGGENIAGDQLARRDWRLGCSPVFRTDRFGVESKHGQFWGRLTRIVL
jgi:hypothetical protein